FLGEAGGRLLHGRLGGGGRQAEARLPPLLTAADVEGALREPAERARHLHAGPRALAQRQLRRLAEPGAIHPRRARDAPQQAHRAAHRFTDHPLSQALASCGSPWAARSPMDRQLPRSGAPRSTSEARRGYSSTGQARAPVATRRVGESALAPTLAVTSKVEAFLAST